MQLDFKGRTVIVTGGARGIGAAICELFAQAGANVMIDYLDIPRDVEAMKALEASLKEMGASYDTFAGDITSAEQMQALCDRTVKRFGSLDILVNSAGYAEPVKMEDISVDLWKKGVEINLSGAFYVTQAAGKHMLSQGRGRIIFIGSAGAFTGGGGSAFYSASKAAINGLVRELSKELAPSGITVNAVLPALIDTDLLRDRQPDPEQRKKYIARVPVGRLGLPEDVAYATLFLASDKAGFISGQYLIVDGGSTFK